MNFKLQMIHRKLYHENQSRNDKVRGIMWRMNNHKTPAKILPTESYDWVKFPNGEIDARFIENGWFMFLHSKHSVVFFSFVE